MKEDILKLAILYCKIFGDGELKEHHHHHHHHTYKAEVEIKKYDHHDNFRDALVYVDRVYIKKNYHHHAYHDLPTGHDHDEDHG